MNKFSVRLTAPFLLFFFCIRLYAQDTAFFSMMQGKDRKGVQKIWMNGGDEFHYFFEFNDRGRGPSLTATARIGADNRINFVRIDGVDYYKNPYHEQYNIEGDSVIWTVNEQRKAKLYKKELYADAQVPGMLELVVHALLQQPGMETTAFNSGKLKMLPLREVKVMFNHAPMSLLLCEIYFGENAPPNFLWLDKDKHFFAGVDEWSSLIQSGYEALIDTLITVQNRQALVYYRQQVDSLSSPLPDALAITHVGLFDAEKAVMLDDMTVLVRGGKIERTGSASSTKVPKRYQVIDAGGKTLMPGLWDMHAHYDKAEGVSYLAGGVTHVRDMGNSDRLLEVRDAIRSNGMLGPDISFVSGFIDQAGPYQGPAGAIVKSLPEAIDAVHFYAKRGYGQIKLYSSVDTAWVAPIAAEAHKLGMRVAGHIPSFMTADRAVREGYDEITHINMVMLNFMGDTIDTRSRGRFYATGQRSKDIDLNSKAANDFIGLLEQKHISFDPTMNVFAEMFTLYPGDTSPALKPVVGWMPESEKQNLALQTSFAPVEQKDMYNASFSKMMEMLKKMYDHHILIVSGTDGGEAFALHHELELYVQAGIPAVKALQTATWNAAKDCNLLSQYGAVKPGLPVDLILVDGNPAQNISDIRRVEWVIKNNRLYYPRQLFAYRGWGYYY